MIFLKWSHAMVWSLAGQDCKAVMYVPGKGAFCLKDGSKAGEPLSSERTAKKEGLHKEIMAFAPADKKESPLVIGHTNCEKSAKSAIKKLGEALIA